MNNTTSSPLDLTITTPLSSSERKCTWPQIVRKEGSVVSLTLANSDELSIKGSITTDIGGKVWTSMTLPETAPFSCEKSRALVKYEDCLYKLVEYSLNNITFTKVDPTPIFF